MERVGFMMRILPGQHAAYRRRHASVWPEMLDALRTAGCRNYSIFVRESDLFAYLEVDDFAAFRASMAASPVNARWQAEMVELIDPLTDPGTGFHERLEEIFHLDRARFDPTALGVDRTCERATRPCHPRRTGGTVDVTVAMPPPPADARPKIAEVPG